MGKHTPPPDFKIHVDPSCLTNSTDLQMSPERVTSNETVVRRDSWSVDAPAQNSADEQTETHDKEQDERERERQIDRIEAQIQAAARAVVASLEEETYHGNQDSELSMQTDESYEGEGTDLSYDGTHSYVDGTDLSFESQGGDHSELHNGIDGTEISYDTENEHPSEHGDVEGGTEAIYESENEESSELHNATNNHVATCESDDEHHPEKEEVHDKMAARYESDNEHHSENDQGGDSSSHHDGDIDDDVFSRNSGHSARSSLNSSDDLHSSDDIFPQKALTSPVVGEEAASSHEDEVISRIPSASSYMHPIPNAERTPSKVLSRPPFRTPSSVRALQMESPTPSIFSSPRSAKRHIPSVSRVGTPSSHTSKNRTPTRFKVKKEFPLVLLHVTVLPLQWPYSHVMSSPELPDSLQSVKGSWRLLQQKLGDAVLERGILLPHPQDSYEVLEERLLEALELPVRPRALILKCGHYMGPHDIETPSSDDDGGEYWARGNETRRKWCDICRRDVRLEDCGDAQGKKFTLKTYASNGLMRAGAWAAVWREMERVDVEIEPYIEPSQHAELERLATITRHITIEKEEQHDDGFVDEEVMAENVHEHDIEHEPLPEHVEAEPERHISDDEQRQMDEEELNKILEEERMREIYGQEQHIPIVEEPERPQPSRRSSSRATVNEDSLPDLLLAAFKVAMRDTKNVAIVVLSILVLMLALRTGAVNNEPQILGGSAVPEILSDKGKQAVEIGRESAQNVVELASGVPSKVAEVALEKSSQVAEAAVKVPSQVAKVAVEKPLQVIEKMREAPDDAEVVEQKPLQPTALVEEPQSEPLKVVEIEKEAPASLEIEIQITPPIEPKDEAATEPIEQPAQNESSSMDELPPPQPHVPEVEQLS
ncbi:hypothetical protein LSUE1_G000700 [Lachnellula suecica]|uniref:Pathway-specific nitrogen regulator n=1 Tax=Lachnellula suecica TaxID=602035 RepID=A0A8T9CQX7_9HELO|nr:hypothetical protein LSUE1_G000700 [Lachnellula suecica]